MYLRQPKRWQYGVSTNSLELIVQGQKVKPSVAEHFHTAQIPKHRVQAALLSVYLYRNENKIDVNS